MKKLFISQPMRGLTDEEILKEREKIVKKAEKAIGEPVESIDNFKIIYKILKILEKSLDCEDVDIKQISNEELNITEARWSRIIKMIVDNGYVEGIRIIECMGAKIPMIKMYTPTITLAGLEYLEENSMMKKVANLVKGVTEIIQ